MKTSNRIIEYIKANNQATGKELADFLDITGRAVRKQLKALIDKKIFIKVGKPPRVFYLINQEKESIRVNRSTINKRLLKIIEQNFLYISSKGERIDGLNGFVRWCQKRNFDPAAKAVEYAKVYKKYNSFKKGHIISGKNKIIETFAGEKCLDDVFYADFYAWEIFGKTKLGQLLLYAKQSQDRKNIKEVILIVKPIIEKFLKDQKIDAVGFIPPTVKREIQFMKVFREVLDIKLPTISIEKAKTEIVTPQKTLNKLQDRIDNANNTIFVTEKSSYNNILLIDDAVGSGATLNQVACKVKKATNAKRVYGFALTGSIKGFDVISEV